MIIRRLNVSGNPQSSISGSGARWNKKRAKLLLEVFGSVQGVKHATEGQLAEIVGEKVAEKVRQYFSEDYQVEVSIQKV